MSLLAPETIDVTVLPWTPIKHYRALPQCPALYFVMTNTQEVFYVGRAQQLKTRWNTHHRLEEFLAFSDFRIAWLEVSDPELLPILENACIEYFQPKANKHPSPKPNDEILVRTVVLLPEDLIEWAKLQPDRLSGVVREAMIRERRRREAVPA